MSEHHGKYTFGKVVAGAAVAVGAVMLAASVFSEGNPGNLLDNVGDKAREVFANIGTALEKLFTAPEKVVDTVTASDGTQITASTPSESFVSKIGGFLSGKSGIALGGTALVGGGLALSGALNDAQADSHTHALIDQVAGDPVPGGHAEKIQMAAMQSLMKGRMIAANPQFMAEMGGGQGVGI